MQYLQLQFKLAPNTEVISDILSAMLGEIGFESFLQNEIGLEAYVPKEKFSSQKVDQLISKFPMEVNITYSFEEIEDKNWNEEWEKNYFQPVTIGKQLCIHSSFHHVDGQYEHRILIDPKMSFGTGHHQTTELMIRTVLEMNLQGKSLLDMGCGTAVLAILASQKGADPITAIDIDEWAYQNSTENVKLNDVNNVRLMQGGAELLGDETYDVILANINRNILLRDIPLYKQVLNANGLLVVSGFYREDISSIRQVCETVGLTYLHFVELDQWVAVTFCFQ